MSRAFGVLKTDAVDINISRQDIGRRLEADLTGKGDAMIGYSEAAFPGRMSVSDK